MQYLKKTDEIIALSKQLTEELRLSKRDNDEYLTDMTKKLLDMLKQLKKSLEEEKLDI